MILFIDNFDSFTFNIVQYLQELKQTVKVIKNNELALSDIDKLKPNAIIIGPGPKTPNDAGICLEAIKRFGGVIPIFGICLGHQAIGQVYGAIVKQAVLVMHGRISPVYHCRSFAFSDVPSPFNATRYHSLVLDKNSLPSCLEVTAWTQDHLEIDEIMGIRHKKLAVEGVQFHPESILSEFGYQILNNFLREHGLAKIDNKNLPDVSLVIAH